MGDALCQYHGCTSPAVMSCTGLTLFENECVTLRCAAHYCNCPSGIRAPLPARPTPQPEPAAGDGATCGAAMPDYEDERRDGPFLCTFPKGHPSPFTYAKGDCADDPIECDHGNPERGGFWSVAITYPSTGPAPVAAVPGLGDIEALAVTIQGVLRGEEMPAARAAARAVLAAGYRPAETVWDEGYLRGTLDTTSDLEPADNPYRKVVEP